MAATITSAYNEYASNEMASVDVTWTSDSSGAASIVLSKVRGEILGFQTIPSTTTGAEPTDNYDVTVKDQDNFDVLGGLGANRDTANVERVDETDLKSTPSGAGYYLPAFPRPTVGLLTFAVANAGAANSGVFRLWFRR